MQSSQIPSKFPIPFANGAGSGYIRQIPVTSQISITPGAASLTDGFPPLTFIAEGAGGIPPFGQDMNGILNEITAWIQWGNAGAPVIYDATFSAAIGGYPKGSILTSGAGGSWWLSTVENNTTNPDTGGAGWLSLSYGLTYAGDPNGNVAGVAATNGALAASLLWDTVHSLLWVCTTTGTSTTAVWLTTNPVSESTWCTTSSGTGNAQILAVPFTSFPAGTGLAWMVGASQTNTGGTSVTVGPFGSFPVVKDTPIGPVPLTGGELKSGNVVICRFDGTSLHLINGVNIYAPVTYTQGSSGAVARTIVSKLQEFVSVLDFGADQTGATDSTTAIQAAINAAIAEQCRLFFPKGTYLVSSVLTVTGTVWISGAGKYVTIVKTEQANASIFNFTGGGYAFELSDMRLQGPPTPTSGSLITCACDSESIRDVALSNYYYGITAKGLVGIYEGVDLNLPATTSSVGVMVEGYAGGLMIDKMMGYEPNITPEAGVMVTACGALQISNSDIVKQGSNLLIIPGNSQIVSSVQCVNSYFDSAQIANINIVPATGGSVVRTYLTQCETSSSSTHGIVINGTSGTVDGVCIVSVQANLCSQNGVSIIGANAKNIDIIGGQCAQNGASGIGIISSANNVSLIGVRAGSGYGLLGNADGVFLDTTVSAVKMFGVIAEGNSGTQIAGSANSNILGCIGAPDTIYPYSASQTLTAAQSGSVIIYSAGASAGTFTLPPPVLGLRYRIVQQAGTVLTIFSGGPAVFYGYGLVGLATSNLTVPANSTFVSQIDLICDGTNWFYSTPYAALGVGQSYNNVTASRAIGTVYTNSEGKYITVIANVAGSPSQIMNGFVNGILVATSGSSSSSYCEAANLVFFVPPGETYEITGTGFQIWFELS